MKNFFVVVLLGMTLIACQSNEGEVFEGEMFLKLIDIGPEVFTSPWSEGQTLADIFDNAPDSLLSTEQLEGKATYQLLKKYDLLDKPSFNFAENYSDKEFVRVFVKKEKEHAKIAPINLSELQREGYKVKISFRGSKVNADFIVCDSIIQVKKVKGAMKWDK